MRVKSVTFKFLATVEEASGVKNIISYLLQNIDQVEGLANYMRNRNNTEVLRVMIIISTGCDLPLVNAHPYLLYVTYLLLMPTRSTGCDLPLINASHIFMGVLDVVFWR